ncbi:hypothetical protein LMJF_04_0975 [Leishmania major strain Friedlin]|uniref:Uncharacterized protein n=1 Tax=Leishmania major TaxID=5664 RepID=E9ACP9_LEIMA|nr:hypothetical protein LMJF_04_0975 [Leishmania major strain Friedlin]CAG9567809.1 hypothetical_protein_-_conserved [Leishmania major strain Friedlin]CBZ05778.1 hypothetical protein LMJF_04_0975 [Leishmania major strain Friedlin]|eukprot:XP_003723253.1 hypothetical protein LMJF_04_0975 [Leishmania major strain Friedlin]
MASTVPWYCRYGVHGDLAKEVNVDGTVVYRTRERRCDCTPPRPCPLVLPAASSHPHPPPPRRRPADPRTAPPRKCGRGRVVGTGRAHIAPSWQKAHTPLPDSSLPCPSVEMDDTRRHVLVPPLAFDSAVGDFYAGYVSSTSHDAAATLPFIPVINPRPAVAGVAPFTAADDPIAAATAPLGVGSCVDSLLIGMSPVPQPPVREWQPAAAAELGSAAPLASDAGNPQPSPPSLLQQDLLSPPVPPSAAAVAAPSSPCTVESHAVDRLCGFLHCPTCGQRVAAAAPSALEAVRCMPAMCPMGPHVAPGAEHGTQARGAASVGRFCFLCGIDKQAPTCKAEASVPPLLPSPQQQPLTATEGHTANAPAKEEACATHALPPAATCGNAAAAASATTTPPPPSLPATAGAASPDLHLDQDLRTVDEVLSHLLRNATVNGGRVRPPCGLPQCRLCDPPAAAATAPTVTPSTWMYPPWHCGWWGTQPVMCGSPAVAIVHHHYAK